MFTILLKRLVYRRDIATLIRFYGNIELNIGVKEALIIIKRSVTTELVPEMAPINVDMSARRKIILVVPDKVKIAFLIPNPEMEL